jgi:allantoate deiminase
MVDSDRAPSARRIWDHCDALARCSEEPDSLTRIFLSEQQHDANGLVLGWMRDAGMKAGLDAIGNCVGRYEGHEPGSRSLVLGSHLDTVRDAGKYDGMLGVVVAIECVRALNARGTRLPFAIEVVGFSDEEGVRFGAALLGSHALAGNFDSALLEKKDRDGLTMRDALVRFGLDPARISSVARQRGEMLAYAELHIEQGPVLESEGLAVGVVTAISGVNRLSIVIQGMAGHAGTVPMTLRRDALVAAAECVIAVEQRCRSVPQLVGTVGRLETFPGATNVIPGRVLFTVDIRSPRDEERLSAVSDLQKEIQRICEARKVSFRITPIHEGGTATCSPWIRQQIGEAIAVEGIPVRELPSGAGHDGMALVGVADIGMLFVRCAAGISHNPAESITIEDIDVSARVFLRFIENFHAAGTESRHG